MNGNTPRILILGGNGLLGSCLSRDLAENADVQPLGRTQCDVTDSACLQKTLEESRADMVLNCAGFLNADRCEREPQQSHLANMRGAVSLAKALRAMKGHKPRLVHFSTDFVFDGEKGNYAEEDLPRPLSVYGTHKYVADELIAASGLEDYWILRVASVIGYTDARGNFLKTIIKAAAAKPHLEIVSDLRITTVTTELVAEVLMKLWQAGAPSGLYNTVASGEASWYALARHAFAELGIDYDIRPSQSGATVAPRPKHSTLLNGKLATATGKALPHWQETLSSHLQKHKNGYMALHQAT